MPKQTPPTHRSLDEEIGFQLRLAQLAVFGDIITALKVHDMRPADMSALLLIAENPGMRQHVIGDRLKMARPNVVSLVDALEKRHLVERVTDEADRRAYNLQLTKDGRLLLKKLVAIQEAHRTRLLTALDGVDFEAFMRGLRQLAALGSGQDDGSD